MNNDEIQKARHAIESWHLGKTSAHYESSGQGTGAISTGKGDHGGVSYGAYQLSSKMGTLAEYLGQSRYGAEFRDLMPDTPAFNAKWKELAKTDPGFGDDQHKFIGKSHYEEQVTGLRAAGIDLSNRGRAVQDALWSTSVQFRGLTPRIFEKGIEEKFGKNYVASTLSDRDIVEAVQDYKIAHNASLFRSSPEWQPGLLRRAKAEKAVLVDLALQEEILAANGLAIARSAAEVNGAAPAQHHVVFPAQGQGNVLSIGEHGKDVRALQESLHRLGYPEASGHPLRLDGDFGGNTEYAVRSFQQAHGLHVDGVVGPRTRDALHEAGQRPLLSERTHTDHALFREAREGVHHLPSGTFRSSVEMDNASASLALKARQSGISHIDHVMMNTRGDGLIAVQGDLDSPARHLASVNKAQAASQSVEQSTIQLAQRAAALQQGSQIAQVHARMENVEHRAGLSMGIRP